VKSHPSTVAPRLSDRQLAAVLGAALLAGVAWPLAFVRIPPYQDLLGHLATVTMLEHPGDYPDYVATGFLKTNAALSTWCVFAGRAVGLVTAARLFVLAVLAAAAFVLPRFVLHFRGRGAMVVSSLVAWPMVHNWYVDMGMLNFALSVPLSLVLLILLDRHRAAPSFGRGCAAAAMGLATWYAHAFPVLVVGWIVIVYAASRAGWPARLRAAAALVPPLVPAALLVGVAIVRHMTTAASAGAGATEQTEYAPAVWQLYNLWAHWMYGFTPLSASSIVAAVVLAAIAARRWRDGPPLLGAAPALAVLIAFVACPYVAFNWGYFSSRLVPFVWAVALARLPARVPRPLAVALAASAVLYFAGNGVDMLRLDAEQREFSAGVGAVPERAQVLFLNFSPRLTSRNTWSLATATGIYAVVKHTNAPNTWTNTASQPIMRRTPPARWEDPIVVRRFLDATRTREGYCALDASRGLDPTLCERTWQDEWRAFWEAAAPEYTHVLMWDPTPDAIAQLPAAYAPVFHAGRLWIWGRR
jgi:hypothetical protein